MNTDQPKDNLMKNIAIIVLSIALILVIIFGNVFKKPDMDSINAKIARLDSLNSVLLHKNDSIELVNKKLDIRIAETEKQVEEKKTKLAKTQLELDKLKKQRNEIPAYVSHLSGDDVADTFTKYLQQRDKSGKGN